MDINHSRMEDIILNKVKTFRGFCFYQLDKNSRSTHLTVKIKKSENSEIEMLKIECAVQEITFE